MSYRDWDVKGLLILSSKLEHIYKIQLAFKANRKFLKWETSAENSSFMEKLPNMRKGRVDNASWTYSRTWGQNL